MSWQLKTVHTGLKVLNNARNRRGNRGPDTILAGLDPERREAPPPASLRRLAEVSPLDIAGRRVLKVSPRDHSSLHVIYLHGGGYFAPMAPAHWPPLAAMVREAGATVWVPSYPLTPEHTVDDSFPLLDALYEVVQQAAGSAPVVLAGDSAGAGLALALAIRARDLGWRPVRRLVLLSPWVDVAMTNPDAQDHQANDVMLRIDEAAHVGKAWAGERALDDPMVSPLHDSLAGLPEMRIYQGEHEIFTPDVKLFVDKARAAGAKVSFTLVPGAGHVYALAVPLVPEAVRAIRHSLEGLAVH